MLPHTTQTRRPQSPSSVSTFTKEPPMPRPRKIHRLRSRCRECGKSAECIDGRCPKHHRAYRSLMARKQRQEWKDQHPGQYPPRPARGRIHERERRMCYEIFNGDSIGCTCCGEKRYELLCIQPVGQPGYSVHNRELLTGCVSVACALLGYPADQFHLVCHNCSNAVLAFGQCPHELERLTQRPSLDAS